MSNEEHPGCLGMFRVYVGDEILPSYVGTIPQTMKQGSHHEPTRIQWKVSRRAF